jgi:glycosyltransferase involved in cell wall biosynthesis
MSKIKVFLGGYVNYTNAQNLNCRSIAEYLDKNKFQVYSLRLYFGSNEKFNFKTFLCFKPFRITYHLGFLWGLLKADVLYLPKHIDTPIWVLRLSKILGKPIFTTIEENVSDLNKINLIDSFGSQQIMKDYFANFNAVFGITQHIIDSCHSLINIRNKPLFLGVDLKSYYYINKKVCYSIIFIGSLIRRKRVDRFIRLAKLFPMLDFKIVGHGIEHENLIKLSTENIIFMGSRNHSEINELFGNSELMFLPSESEGFPKVILEAAAAGVASIVYKSYGANAWIEDKKNGFIVSSFDEVVELINEILANPILLQKASKETKNLAQRFDWKDVIHDWEEIIIDLYNG